VGRKERPRVEGRNLQRGIGALRFSVVASVERVGTYSPPPFSLSSSTREKYARIHIQTHMATLVAGLYSCRLAARTKALAGAANIFLLI